MLFAAATVLAAAPALAAAGKADRHRVETEVKSSLTTSINKAAAGTVVPGLSNTTLIAAAAGVVAVAVTVVVASDSSPATTG